MKAVKRGTRIWKEEIDNKMTEGPISINDDSFEETVLRSSLPVLVDFWAPWCAPCLITGPILEELAKEFEGRILMTKFNLDEGSHTPAQYGIMAIPTLIVFKDSREVDRLIGAFPKHVLTSKIEALL
jgi:thioredoxin 1